jgi:TQXA domain-containing protein/LPXTG-motif cell wall-anchored protein
MPTSSSAATTTDYVGYLKSTGTSANVATGTSSVPDIYVLPLSDYNSYTATQRAAGGTVAYCFNKSKHEPYNRTSGWWKYGSKELESGRCLYTKIANADAATFASLADSERVTGEAFRNWIISIGLNGYPLDYSGFNTAADGTKLLSDEAFRTVTQWAIWYYTDSYNPYAQSFYTPVGNAKIVYDKLISTLLPESVTKAGVSSIDLYQSKGGAFTNATIWDGYKYIANSTDTNEYQNLLAVNTTYQSDLPEYKDLTLTKSVVNLDGSTTSDDFTFTITLSTSNFWYETTGGANITKSTDGKTLTVALGNSDSITLHVAETSYDYTITETPSETYTASATVDGSSATVTDGVLAQKGVTADTAVVYTNTENKVETTTGIGTLTLQKAGIATTDVPEKLYSDFAAFTFKVTLTRDGEPYTGPTEDDLANLSNDDKNKLVASSVVYYTGTSGRDEDLETQKIATDGTVTFTGITSILPVTLYLPAGVHYTVTEIDLPKGFSVSSSSGTVGTVTADGEHTATITNTFSNDYRVHVTKVWDDEGHSSHRTEVSFRIIGTTSRANAAGTGNDITQVYDISYDTDSTSNWTGYFTRTKYSKGSLINYTVEETSVHEGYTATIVPTDGCNNATCNVPCETFTITNKYDESLLNDITITKTLASDTPATDTEFPFTVTLSDPNYDGKPTFSNSSGTVNKSATITTSDTGVTITFTLKAGETVKIPAIYSGTAYQVSEGTVTGYDVDETDGYYTVGTGSEKTGIDSDASVFEGTIENEKNTPWHLNFTYVNESADATTKITATKSWEDNGHTAHRPSSISLTLYEKVGAAGTLTATQHTYTLTADTNWRIEVNDLAKKSNGQEVTYALKEDNVPEGYEAQASVTDDGHDYSFVNTYKEELLNTLTVTKQLVDGETDTTTAFPFTVTISDTKYDGTAYVQNASGGKARDITFTKTSTGGTFTFSLKAGETAVIPALYSGTTYTVEEGTTEGYTLYSVDSTYKLKSGDGSTSTLTPVGGVVSGTLDNTANDPYEVQLTFTNQKDDGSTCVTVTKQWDDAGHTTHRPSSISFILYQTVNNVKTAIGTYTLDKDDATSNNANVWQETFEDLPTKVNGYSVTYSVAEVDADDGYITTYGDDGLTIINTYNKDLLNDITITKTLKEGTTADANQQFSFTVTLDDPNYDGILIFSGNSKSADKNSNKTYTTSPIYDDNGFKTGTKITFSLYVDESVKIPRIYSGTYCTAEEDSSTYYDVADIDVTYTIGDSENTWKLDDTATLFAGTIQNTKDVPMHIKVTYINEEKTTSTGITAKKVWSDSGHSAHRPDSVKVTLYSQIGSGALSATSKTYTLNKSNNWTYVVSDLAKHMGGKEVTYALKEDDVPEGYAVTSTTTTDSDGNPVYTFTNTYDESLLNDITLTKKLEEGTAATNTSFSFTVTLDDPNYDGTPTFQDGDGTAISRTATITRSTTGVTITFSLKADESIHIPAIYSGTYCTVVENPTQHYDVSDIDVTYEVGNSTTDWPMNDASKLFAGTINNTKNVPYHINVTYYNEEDTTSTGITAEKIWNDSGHTAHRPDSVKVALYAQIGNEAMTATSRTYTLNAANNWSYTATNLAKHISGQTVTYTMREVDIPEGYAVTTQETSDTVTFTNTYDESLLSTMTIKKVLAEGETDDGTEFPFTVTLSDAKYDGTPTFTGSGTQATIQHTATGTTITFSLKAGETATIPALYSGTAYTVTEGSTEGYTLQSATGYYKLRTGTQRHTVTATDGVISGTVKAAANNPHDIHLTFTNQAVDTTPETYLSTLTVKKIVASGDVDTEESAQPSTEPSAEPSTEPSAESSTEPSAEVSTQPTTEPEASETPESAEETGEPDAEAAEEAVVSTVSETEEVLIPSETFDADGADEDSEPAAPAEDNDTEAEAVPAALTDEEPDAEPASEAVEPAASQESSTDADQAFPFTVTIFDLTYTGTPTGAADISSTVQEEKGCIVFTFNLKDGEEVQFPDLKSGTQYKVEEGTTSGYTLKDAAGYYEDADGTRTTVPADKGVFNALVPDSASYSIVLTYTNQKTTDTAGPEEPTETPEPSETPKSSETPEPSETPKPSETPAPSETPEPSETPSVEVTPSPEPSATTETTPAPTPTVSESPTPSKSTSTSTSTTGSTLPQTGTNWWPVLMLALAGLLTTTLGGLLRRKHKKQ